MYGNVRFYIWAFRVCLHDADGIMGRTPTHTIASLSEESGFLRLFCLLSLAPW